MDYKKVVVVGSAACGKTSLVHRAVNGTFSSEYQQTFGADLTIKMSTDNKKANLQIWCCGGHERYRALLDQFFSDANIVILCFDMLDIASFSDLSFWHNEMKRSTPSAKSILIGLKSDEVDSVVVKAQDAVETATGWGIEFRTVSAKTGQGVNELFDAIHAGLSKS